MRKDLSQIAADVFAGSAESRELLPQVQRVVEEIRKALRSDDTISGKLQGLLESLRTVLPDERQRYHAALQAISSTSKLSRLQILGAMSGQLEELQMVEQRLVATARAWRDGLRGMEARSQQLKGEIAYLYQRLGQLESEERSIQNGVSAEGDGLTLAERTMRELFTALGAEMSSVCRKIEEATPEAPAAPAPQRALQKEAGKSLVPSGGKKVAVQKVAAQRAAPKQHRSEKMEEAPEAPALDKASGPATGPALSDVERATAIVDATGPVKGSSRSGNRAGAKKKTCPVCYKKMVWSQGEKVWRCPLGHHGTRGGSGPG